MSAVEVREGGARSSGRPRPGGNSVWPLRPLGRYPQVYVRPKGESIHVLWVESREDAYGWEIEMTRQEARLLARRLNQALDATVKR